MSKDWYKIKILGKEVNWASVIASGVIFLALEMYRRKNLSKQVKSEVKKSVEKLASVQKSNQSAIDKIIDRIT